MKKKVLIIEDDLVACRALQKRLAKAGIDVDCALDGEEGLAKSHNGYDCILLDFALPTVDDWQVLNELKNYDGTKQTPVVICSVLDDDDYRKQVESLGADGYVNIFHEDVLSEVEKILGGGHLKKSSPKAS